LTLFFVIIDTNEVLLTASERDGLMVLVIGAFTLIVSLLVLGFGWFAGQDLERESVALPTATLADTTPLPVRPPDPTATLRGGNPVPSGATPIPPEFPSATPNNGYPGPIRGTPVPLETATPSPTVDGNAEPTTPTPPLPATATVETGSPVPGVTTTPTPRVSPSATRPGSTPTGVTATPDPTPQPPVSTPTIGGYPPPPTIGPLPTSTPYPGP
jgi:hypothetical protein